MHTYKQRYTLDVCPPVTTTHAGIFLACRIADRYRTRLPKPAELMNDFGMSRATAFRWISSLRQARAAVFGKAEIRPDATVGIVEDNPQEPVPSGATKL